MGHEVADDGRATITMPPIVGVPALVVWPEGTSSWIGWPIGRLRSQSMRNRVPKRRHVGEAGGEEETDHGRSSSGIE